MQKFSTLGNAVLVSVLLVFSMSSLAAAEGEQAVKIPDKEAGAFRIQQLNKSGEMIGQIALARKSLKLGLDDDAVYHIDRAEGLASDLQKQAPELAVASTLRFGDKVYSFNNEYKDYLIPAVDDLFTVTEYDTKVQHQVQHRGRAISQEKKDDVAAVDADVSRYQLALNIRNVQDALDNARDLTREGEIDKAQAALNDIYQGAVETSTVYDDPVWAVHDNLMVASAMLKDRDYDGARYAVQKAESELHTIRKSGQYPGDAEVLKKMEGETNDLQQALKQEDPGLLQEAGSRIAGWLESLRGLGAKHRADRAANEAGK